MEAFVARQPIMDRQQRVTFYELFFRSGLENFFDGTEYDKATADVIVNSFFVIGIKKLTGGKRALVNFTENLLINDIASILPPNLIGIEILETVEPSDDVIAACKKLKQMGYFLVLDDFVFEDRLMPLVKLADIIKVDFLNTTMADKISLVKRFGNKHTKFLAEKLEGQEDFEFAFNLGYSYFQGYYFSKPDIVVQRDIPSFKINYLMLLKEITKPVRELNFDLMEMIIKRDISISYKLLKYINCIGFQCIYRIKSIKHALVLLGQKEVMKWISLYILKGLGNDKPDVLMLISISRARFCELLAPLGGLEKHSFELFLMGMFSMIDALMDQPKPLILESLPISDEVKNVLLEGNGKYSNIYHLMLSYEKGRWESVSSFCKILHISEKEVAKVYLEAVNWTNRIILANCV
ncbi:EAL and HDOD domain-containing protein [Candidatus Formimonas warabiya]|uniref:HDOD domain-containing protein n=1 Tax=Formimonas warabiya TaxID=1761012 RepID=A0A3G1KLW2_FORW1|nr:EAL domain-containing protein [Candidatus Formimonas warabiya]ATW23411.1 hypothetical protein DCMF_00130 [Candidatus Formimonas warabiya]